MSKGPDTGVYSSQCSGTGRRTERTTRMSRPRMCDNHAPNSSRLGTVAERHTKRMWAGAKISDSSHTEPRSRSSM